MKKLTKINKQDIPAIREILQKQLAALEKELNVKLTVGHATYSDTAVDFKVNFAIVNDDGAVETFERQFFKRNHYLFGFTATDLGKEFNVEKYGRFRLTGLRNSRKFPVIAENVNTKQIRYFPVETVSRALQTA